MSWEDYRLLWDLLVENPVDDVTMNWRSEMNDRNLQEIALAEFYAKRLGHGTDGHNRLILIAHLSAKLDLYERTIRDLLREDDQSSHRAAN
jgi:hypothetical protein